MFYNRIFSYLYKMKKVIFIGLMFCFAFTIKAQQNLVLNGSFENNNPVVIDSTGAIDTIFGCWSNLMKIEYESVILYSYYFGDESMTALMKDSCLWCITPEYWGGGGKRWRLLSFNGRRRYANFFPFLD